MRLSHVANGCFKAREIERKGAVSNPIRLEVSFTRTGEQPFGLLLKVHGT